MRSSVISGPGTCTPRQIDSSANAVAQLERVAKPGVAWDAGATIIHAHNARPARRGKDLQVSIETGQLQSGWSIELEFIEEVIEDVLDVLCMIQKDPWSFLHMPEKHRRVLRSNIEEIRSIVTTRGASGSRPRDPARTRRSRGGSCSAWRTQFQIDCAVGSNSRDSESGVRSPTHQIDHLLPVLRRIRRSDPRHRVLLPKSEGVHEIGSTPVL